MKETYLLKFNGIPTILILLAISRIILGILYFTKPQLPQGFEKVKDLVRGTLTSDITELHDAFSHFK